MENAALAKIAVASVSVVKNVVKNNIKNMYYIYNNADFYQNSDWQNNHLRGGTW